MLRFEEVSLFSKEYRDVKPLYKRAFPLRERVPIWMLMFRARSPNVRFVAAYDGDEFCGLAYYFVSGNILYLLYLAVNDRLRGRGYGSEILGLLREGHPGLDVFLDIEPPDEPAKNGRQRRKRLRFYERNGFRRTGWFIDDES